MIRSLGFVQVYNTHTQTHTIRKSLPWPTNNGGNLLPQCWFCTLWLSWMDRAAKAWTVWTACLRPSQRWSVSWSGNATSFPLSVFQPLQQSRGHLTSGPSPGGPALRKTRPDNISSVGDLCGEPQRFGQFYAGEWVKWTNCSPAARPWTLHYHRNGGKSIRSSLSLSSVEHSRTCARSHSQKRCFLYAVNKTFHSM